MIAEAITAHLPELTGTNFDRVEIAGPGFINLYASPELVHRRGARRQRERADGRTDFGQGLKYNVEFVSANPTGPMHMGNARGGALGDCLAAVLDWAGYDVTREFYLNDAGNQIQKFGKSLSVRYRQAVPGRRGLPPARGVLPGRRHHRPRQGLRRTVRRQIPERGRGRAQQGPD